MPFPKSRAFWVFATVSSSLTTAYALDRYRLGEIRERFKDDARKLGMQPASDSFRKVTIVSVGRDAEELRKTRQLWKTFAVDLFTLAGCDYQIIEINADALDRELDKMMPVAEGDVPATDKPAPKVVTAENWLTPTMSYWISKLNKDNREFVKLIEEWKNSNDVIKSTLYKLWERSRPEPKSRLFFDEGIIALNSSTFSSLVAGTKSSSNSKCTVMPKLGYIPCDPSPNWISSVGRFFRKSQIADSVGRAALDILHDKVKPSSDGGNYVVFVK